MPQAVFLRTAVPPPPDGGGAPPSPAEDAPRAHRLSAAAARRLPYHAARTEDSDPPPRRTGWPQIQNPRDEAPMKTPRTSRPMSADAYAGFLKLWLTPAGKAPRPSAEVDAYLRHANQREPLSDATRRVLGHPTERAA